MQRAVIRLLLRCVFPRITPVLVYESRWLMLAIPALAWQARLFVQLQQWHARSTQGMSARGRRVLSCWLVSLSVLLVCIACAKQEIPLPEVKPVPEADVTGYQAPVPYTPPPEPVPLVPPTPKPPVEHEVRHTWQDGQAFEVLVGIGYPTVIRFGPGEHIASLVDGDRTYLAETEEPKEEKVQQQVAKQTKEQQANCYWSTSWQWCKGVSEQQYTPIEHLAFTATHVINGAGLPQKQGVVVFTDQRTYYLDLKAVRATKTRLVSWVVPVPPPPPPKPRDPGLFPEAGRPRLYHIGYTQTTAADAPDWTPRQVWSDPPGVPAPKMYLEFPPVVLAQRMPLLRGMNERGKPYLLNSRQYGTWIVVDELAPRLELRRGADDDAQIVIITREQLRPLHCPGDPECPVFP